MEKYHKTDIAPVEQENERDENYRADNPQIDAGRTRENYNIIKRQRSYTQFIMTGSRHSTCQPKYGRTLC